MGETAIVSTKDVVKFCSNPNLVSYVAMLSPRRPGVVLFSVMLEHIFFKPGTEKNDNFVMHMMNWQDMTFGIISIPTNMKKAAEEVAKHAGVRIADGVPTMFDPSGTVEIFPISKNNVFTLENESGHPMYKGIELREAMLNIEDQLVDKIFEGTPAEEFMKK